MRDNCWYYAEGKLSKALEKYEKTQELDKENEKAKYSYRKIKKKHASQKMGMMLGAIRDFFNCLRTEEEVNFKTNSSVLH